MDRGEEMGYKWRLRVRLIDEGVDKAVRERLEWLAERGRGQTDVEYERQQKAEGRALGVPTLLVF